MHIHKDVARCSRPLVLYDEFRVERERKGFVRLYAAHVFSRASGERPFYHIDKVGVGNAILIPLATRGESECPHP